MAVNRAPRWAEREGKSFSWVHEPTDGPAVSTYQSEVS
jgi:hypothetical protein